MNPERKKIRSVLSYMSGFGLLISTGIHIATLRDINIEKDYPFIYFTPNGYRFGIPIGRRI